MKSLYHVKIEGNRPNFNYVQVYAVNKDDAAKRALTFKDVNRVLEVIKL